MILDKTSQNALETFLGMTFGSKTEHYQVVSEKGLDYPLINDIELNYNKDIKKVYSPFSTFISKSILANVESVNILKDGIEEIKKLSIFSIFSKISNKKEELKTILEATQKCISDELVKSKKILENRELENPAILLLLKGIKNIEKPENIKGLNKSAIQEVGALQIGMSINSLIKDIPNIFKHSKNDKEDFLYFMNKIQENKFIKNCCENAKIKEKSIIELYIAAEKDKQFDAFITSNGNIDYNTSFSDLTNSKKTIKISEIKKESRNTFDNNRFK